MENNCCFVITVEVKSVLVDPLVFIRQCEMTVVTTIESLSENSESLKFSMCKISVSLIQSLFIYREQTFSLIAYAINFAIMKA